MVAAWLVLTDSFLHKWGILQAPIAEDSAVFWPDNLSLWRGLLSYDEHDPVCRPRPYGQIPIWEERSQIKVLRGSVGPGEYRIADMLHILLRCRYRLERLVLFRLSDESLLAAILLIGLHFLCDLHVEETQWIEYQSWGARLDPQKTHSTRGALYHVQLVHVLNHYSAIDARGQP